MLSNIETLTKLSSFPSAFHVNFNCSDYVFQIIFQLIKEARRMIMNLKLSMLYFMGANIMLFGIQVFALVTMLPMVFNGIQAMWQMLIIIPILAISFMANPVEPKIMDLISAKNSERKFQYTAALLHAVLRFSIPIPICIVVFISALTSSGLSNVTWATVWGGQIPISTFQSGQFQGSLIVAQSITHFVAVLYFVTISIMYISRAHSIFVIFPFRNWMWMLSCVIVLIAQAVFSVLSCIMFAAGQSYPAFPVTNFFYSV
jgi:magnesium-transporting ATPase (P-type)